MGGIGFNPSGAVGEKYNVAPGRGDRPVNFVDWFDAVRFANWLNNGQGNADTEVGSYTLLGGTPIPSNANSIFRNVGVQIVLRNLSEWYKAAYYDPATEAYTSISHKAISSKPTPDPNRANLSPDGQNDLTDVGAYTGTKSPFGLFDAAGNVLQWNETLAGGALRAVRGSSFADSNPIEPWTSRSEYPSHPAANLGFRIAVVPEPPGIDLATIGAALMLAVTARRARDLWHRAERPSTPLI